MRNRLHSEDGFSLPELLIAMTIMLIVMLATLATLDSFRSRQALDERRSDTQESLRRGIDHLQRQLRNLATPQLNVKSIYRAQDTDLIFQTADPQKRWVRYCTDPSDPLIASGRANLWYGVSNVVSDTPPTAAGCPGTGWSTMSPAGTSVVNTRDGLARSIFKYNWPRDGSGNEITTDTSAITRVRADLWVDVNPGASPPEQRLTSGVFLRNQNQAPVAGFTACCPVAKVDGNHIVLNASSTTDFEGRRLSYYWYYGASPSIPVGCKPPATPPTSYLGSGIVLEAVLPLTSASPQNVTLCAIDPGDLEARLTKQVTF